MVLCKVEIELMQNLLYNFVWLNRSRIRLDRSKLGQNVFLQNSSNLAQARLTCRVLCFVLSIKGKTLATFWLSIMLCMWIFCEIKRWLPSHILRVSKIQDYVKNLVIEFSCCIKELKETQAGVLVFVGESKKEGIRGLGACTWSCQ